MALIQVNPEELYVQGSQFKLHAEEIQQIVAKLDQMKNQLIEEWKGSASNAFMNQYDLLHLQIVRFYTVIGEMGDQVNSIATIVDNANNGITAKTSYYLWSWRKWEGNTQCLRVALSFRFRGRKDIDSDTRKEISAQEQEIRSYKHRISDLKVCIQQMEDELDKLSNAKY